MKTYTHGEDVMMITKYIDVDLVRNFDNENKYVNLISGEKKADGDVGIKKRRDKGIHKRIKNLKVKRKKYTALCSVYMKKILCI